MAAVREQPGSLAWSDLLAALCLRALGWSKISPMEEQSSQSLASAKCHDI